VIDYDKRERGTDIETSTAAAGMLIQQLDAKLASLNAAVVSQAVQARMMHASDGEPMTVPSSVGRELAFVLSHTIHHGAMVAAMVRTLGGEVPKHFGYAPATVAHLRSASCAQ